MCILVAPYMMLIKMLKCQFFKRNFILVLVRLICVIQRGKHIFNSARAFDESQRA